MERFRATFQNAFNAFNPLVHQITTVHVFGPQIDTCPFLTSCGIINMSYCTNTTVIYIINSNLNWQWEPSTCVTAETRCWKKFQILFFEAQHSRCSLICVALPNLISDGFVLKARALANAIANTPPLYPSFCSWQWTWLILKERFAVFRIRTAHWIILLEIFELFSEFIMSYITTSLWGWKLKPDANTISNSSNHSGALWFKSGGNSNSDSALATSSSRFLRSTF